MKKLLIIAFTAFSLTAQAAEIEIYQFWSGHFGYTCNTSKTIIEEALAENYPKIKYEIINLEKQSSNSVLPNSYLNKKAVAILNKDTGEYFISDIRKLISLKMPSKTIKKAFINEIKSTMTKYSNRS